MQHRERTRTETKKELFVFGWLDTSITTRHKAQTTSQHFEWRRQLWGTGARAPSTSNNFNFCSLWSKSDNQLSMYCVVCEISWCICQQLTALSISTALVTKLLVIKQLLHSALKFAVSAPWHNFHLCPSSQQMLATPLDSFSDTHNQLQCNPHCYTAASA